MRSILLVDDDESHRITLSVLLEDEGFAVEVAASSAAARASLEAGGARFDAVILDQHLGDGTGSALLPLVHERAPRAVTLLVSGSLGEGDRAVAGFDVVLGKGLMFPELLARLEEALARAPRPS